MKEPEKVKVWDPAVRLFHWTLLAAFITAVLTKFDLLGLHVLAGYVIAILVAMRIVWGFLGDGHARFSDFVKTPAEVVAYLRDMVRLRHKRHIGHNPAAGVMIIALLLALMTTVVTGLLTYGAKEIAGPFAYLLLDVGWLWGEKLEDVHHVSAELTLILGGLHIIGATVESLMHKENLALAMITGYKRKNEINQSGELE